MGIPTSKSWHFEATEDIKTKFKPQGLHIIWIKYLNTSGSGSPSPLIPALWNIGILLHKQANTVYSFWKWIFAWKFLLALIKLPDTCFRGVQTINLPCARHYNPLLIRNHSWILTIHKARILRKKPLEKTFLDFKKWVIMARVRYLI